MTKEIKDYLHLYLGCEVEYYDHSTNETYSGLLRGVADEHALVANDMQGYPIAQVKPILRPLSDMTHEELQECGNMLYDFSGDPKLNNHRWQDFELCFPEQAHWLLKRHFDLFGLIESGLAISSICDECSGTGEIERTLGGGGNPEYDAPTVCTNCKGTGNVAYHNQTLQTV